MIPLSGLRNVVSIVLLVSFSVSIKTNNPSTCHRFFFAVFTQKIRFATIRRMEVFGTNVQRQGEGNPPEYSVLTDTRGRTWKAEGDVRLWMEDRFGEHQ